MYVIIGVCYPDQDIGRVTSLTMFLNDISPLLDCNDDDLLQSGGL